MTSNGTLATREADAIVDQVLVDGDLSRLTPEQRTRHYMRVCSSMRLNPLTKPFSYIKLQGKLTLYALRDCTDQLRKLHEVSIEILENSIANGLLTVHVRAKMPNGRQDEDIGVVPFPANLQGEAAANQKMKGVTKSKRRVTLSICGMGMLDETEVASIPDAEYVEVNDDGEIVATRPVRRQQTMPPPVEPGPPSRPASAAQLKRLRTLMEKAKVTEQMIQGTFEVEKLTDLTVDQFNEAIIRCNRKLTLMNTPATSSKAPPNG